jgi:outer membrane protein assembly factor BamA
MKSIKTITLLMVLMTIIFSNQANAHIETIANLEIEHAEDGLTITARLEKHQLTYALKKEAKCHPKDMMRVCANKYVKDNIKVLINGKSVAITKVSQQLTKHNLTITYKVIFKETIKKVAIKSDYMIKYNNHSKVRVISRLKAENKIYNLTAKRKQITILV